MPLSFFGTYSIGGGLNEMYMRTKHLRNVDGPTYLIQVVLVSESRGLARSNEVAYVYNCVHDQWTTCTCWMVPDLCPIARHRQQCMPKERNDLTKVV